MSDLHSNIAWFEFGALLIACILLIISAVLAARAYAALSEMRMLTHRADMGSPAHGRLSGARQSTPENIGAAARRVKARANRRSLP